MVIYASPRGGVTYGPIGFHVLANPVELERIQANAQANLLEHSVPTE